MLAILVAFGAALFIWFHHDPGPTPADTSCYVPESFTETAQPLPFDFTREVFENDDPDRGDTQ